ncbi:MAG: hypothetical protein RJB26_2449 [Pseudomonadota bacterium]
MSEARVNLRQLLDGIVSAPAVDFRHLRVDSRRVVAGDVFVALQGTREHGLVHAARAAAAGAVAVLSDAAEAANAPVLPASCVLVPVPGLRSRLGLLADRAYGAPSADVQVVGITGTNGKTTSAWLLAAALEQLGHPAAYAGTLGAGRPGAVVAGTHTTPDVFSVHAQLAAFRDAGAKFAAIEVSSHALDQGRVDGVRFMAAAYTHLTRDHLDYHVTMDAYAAAKARLFCLPGLAHAVLNVEDAAVRTVVRRLGPATSLTTVSALPGSAVPHAGAYVQCRTIVPATNGLEVVYDTHAGEVAFTAPLVGRFNAENLALVIGLLLALGVTAEQAATALAVTTPPPGRMQLVVSQDGAQAIIDYAHTPDALEKALVAAREHCAGQLWVVFGCGGDRDAGKRPQMGGIACRLADRVVITDDNPRSESGDAIAAMVLEGCSPEARAAGKVSVCRDRRLAIESALQQADATDLVLIAGKGHETTQTVGTEVLPFSDAVVAAAVRRAA